MSTRIVFTLFLISLSTTVAKADLFSLSNGDKISGTIVSLKEGQLNLKSDLLGNISLKWDSISTINSNELMYVKFTDGSLLSGLLSLNSHTLTVKNHSQTFSRDRTSIVSILPHSENKRPVVDGKIDINTNSRNLWSGTIDAAISATKGNADMRTMNLDVRAARTAGATQLTGYFNTAFANNLTTGTSIPITKAIRGGARYELNIRNRIFTFGFTDLEYDRFQDLDLRLVVGGGLGIDLLETSRVSLETFAGVSSNQEFFINGFDRKSAESMFGQDLTYFISPLTSIRQRLSVFPNMSDFGEFRLTFETTAVTQLNKWFSWQTTLSDRYMSNPAPGKKGNDFSFTTGIRITAGDNSFTRNPINGGRTN